MIMSAKALLDTNPKPTDAQIKQALELPDTQTRATAAGIELRFLPPEALDALVKRETEFWAKTIKSAGITAD